MDMGVEPFLMSNECELAKCWVLMSINFQNFDQNIKCSGIH